MEGKLIKEEEEEYYALYTNKGIFISDVNGNYMASTLNGKNKLSLKNCQAIENGYDLDELADEYYKRLEVVPYKSNGFKSGFQKALEILGDKKFSADEIIKAYNEGWSLNYDYFQSLQQTEWDVEIVMENSVCNGYKNQPDNVIGFIAEYKSVPKLDEDGCLILKRK